MNHNLDIIKRSGRLTVERQRRQKPVRVKMKDFPNISDTHYEITRTWTEDAELELQVNMVKLMRHLGERAISNKTGKASTMHGIIKITVRRRTESNIKEIENQIPECYEEVA